MTTTLENVAPGSNPETPTNHNFDTMNWAGLYGKRYPATAGLVWGYYGGRYAGNVVADGTVTTTNAATNYVVANRNTGAVSTSTATTNWDDVVKYARLFKLTTAGSAVTAVEDHRAGGFGPYSSPLTRNNFSTADQTPAAATRTYLTGSSIIIPDQKLRIGTCFRWSFDMTKSAAGSAASTIDVAVGTAGTTADTARVSFTKPAGTAAADHGRVVIEVICRGPLSSSGRFSGVATMTHNLENTGHLTTPCYNEYVLSGTFDVTTASLIVGLCLTSGASDSITIHNVMAEAWNLG